MSRSTGLYLHKTTETIYYEKKKDETKLERVKNKALQAYECVICLGSTSVLSSEVHNLCSQCVTSALFFCQLILEQMNQEKNEY